jgi:hypothetical protein
MLREVHIGRLKVYFIFVKQLFCMDPYEEVDNEEVILDLLILD